MQVPWHSTTKYSIPYTWGFPADSNGVVIKPKQTSKSVDEINCMYILFQEFANLANFSIDYLKVAVIKQIMRRRK